MFAHLFIVARVMADPIAPSSAHALLVSYPDSPLVAADPSLDAPETPPYEAGGVSHVEQTRAGSSHAELPSAVSRIDDTAIPASSAAATANEERSEDLHPIRTSGDQAVPPSQPGIEVRSSLADCIICIIINFVRLLFLCVVCFCEGMLSEEMYSVTYA